MKYRLEYSPAQNCFHAAKYNAPLPTNKSWFTVCVLDDFDSTVSFINNWPEIDITQKQLFIDDMLNGLFPLKKPIRLKNTRYGKQVSNPSEKSLIDKVIRFLKAVQNPFEVSDSDIKSALFMGDWVFSQENTNATSYFKEGLDKHTQCVFLSNKDIARFYAMSNAGLSIYKNDIAQESIKNDFRVYFNCLMKVYRSI